MSAIVTGPFSFSPAAYEVKNKIRNAERIDFIPVSYKIRGRWQLMVAEAEAAHGGRSRPCMAAEAAATRRAPSFPSARRPPPLRRMLPRPTGQSCLCTAGDSRKELLTQMQLHNHLCPSSARSAHFSHLCIPSRYHRNPLRACDISVQEFVV